MSNAVVTDWPSGSGNAGWPQEPTGMLMPGRVQGWPAGTQRAANAAERLLSQAVAWWDVGQYRDGDRFLRNRGTGGELLDLRLGSAAVANSNDPRFLPAADEGYVFIPGPTSSITADCLTVPDAADLRLTGDVEMVFRVSAVDWTPTRTAALGGKDHTTTGRGYALLLRTTGALAFHWSPDGTDAGATFAPSTASVPFADGDTGWVKVTFDCDNGASGKDIKFFTAPDSVSEPTSWTQLGNTVTQAGTASIFATTQSVTFGYNRSSQDNWHGHLFRMIVRNGIDGTTVLDIDCDAITTGSATSFTAVTNQTVTINRSTSGRKSVAVPSRHKGGKPVMLLGTDDFMQIVDNWHNGLLSFAQEDSATIVAYVRQWATAVSGGGYVTKYDSAGPGGYIVGRSGATTNNRSTLQYFTVEVVAKSAAAASGTAALVAGVKDGVAKTNVSSTGGAAGTVLADITRNRIGPATAPFYIGRLAGIYQDFEFYGAAIFRRALSPAEITTLSNYFTGRIA